MAQAGQEQAKRQKVAHLVNLPALLHLCALHTQSLPYFAVLCCTCVPAIRFTHALAHLLHVLCLQDLGFTDVFGAPGAVQQALLAILEIQAASELSQSCTELRPVFKAKLGSVSKLRLNFVMRLDVVRQQLDLLKERAPMLQQVTEVNTFCPTDMVVALLVDLLRLHYPRLTKLVLRLGHWQLPDGLCFWLPPTLQELTLAAETDEDDGQLDVVFGDWSSNWKRLIVEGADAGSTNIHLPTSDVMLDKLYLVCTCPTFSGWSQARYNQANFFVKDLLAVDLCQPVLECIKGVVTAWVQFTSVSFAQIVEAWPGIEELQAMGDYEDMRLAASDSFPAAGSTFLQQSVSGS